MNRHILSRKAQSPQQLLSIFGPTFRVIWEIVLFILGTVEHILLNLEGMSWSWSAAPPEDGGLEKRL